jgi:hypothetical protein
MDRLCLDVDLLDPELILARSLSGRRRLRMGRWVQPCRRISDLQFAILLLTLGFITGGVLMIFRAYTLAR